MPASPPARRPLAATLLALSAVAGVMVSGAPARAVPTAPPRPAGGAAMVGWHEKGDDLEALRAHEAALGTRFALVRLYQQWQAPSAKVGILVAEGRLVLASHKPPAAGWAAVASGAEDATIGLLADRYRAYGREVLFSFHHEPHDDALDLKGGTAGTAADYLAAWRRIHRVFVERGAHRSAGGNVYFAYIATGSWALAATPGGPPGSADPLYPGSDIVDVLAHDRYNWASCRGDDWEEFAENWSPLVALAARLGKPLIAGELGAPPAGGLRNDWFRRGAEWMRNDDAARQWMWGFAYYHSLHDTCPWDFLNQGDDGAPGWRDAFSHPYFTGTPFSLASPLAVAATPAPAPPPVAPLAAPAPTRAPAPAPAPTPAGPAGTTTTAGPVSPVTPATTVLSPPPEPAPPLPQVAVPAAPPAPPRRPADPADPLAVAPWVGIGLLAACALRRMALA